MRAKAEEQTVGSRRQRRFSQMMKIAFESDGRPIDWRWITLQLLFIGLVVGFPFGIATTDWIWRDGDTGWQVASGEWILRHSAIPTTDPFSFTAAGHSWVAMEWIAEVIFAAAFNIAGYAGLATLVCTALIAVQAIIFFYLQDRVPSAVVAATLIMLDLVLAPFLLARPHVLSWILIAGWTVLLLSSAEKGRPPPLWSTVILILWTNLHASFPISLAIAGAIGLDALIESRGANLREWIVFGLASAVAVCLNANGVAGLLQPFRTSSLSMLPLINEWHPSSPQITPFFFAVVLVGIGALIWAGKRLPIGRLSLLLLLLSLAFAHLRHQSMFIIVAACVIPTLWQRTTSQAGVPKWMLLCALPLLIFRAASPLVRPDTAANPTALIAAIPTDLRSEPVFNGYGFGGSLILAGIRPYIDGRAEIYGDAFVKDYFAMTRGDMIAFNRTVAKYGIRWIILSHDDGPLIKAVESSGAWHRIQSDRVGVLEVRNDVHLQH